MKDVQEILFEELQQLQKRAAEILAQLPGIKEGATKARAELSHQQITDFGYTGNYNHQWGKTSYSRTPGGNHMSLEDLKESYVQQKYTNKAYELLTSFLSLRAKFSIVSAVLQLNYFATAPSHDTERFKTLSNTFSQLAKQLEKEFPGVLSLVKFFGSYPTPSNQHVQAQQVFDTLNIYPFTLHLGLTRAGGNEYYFGPRAAGQSGYDLFSNDASEAKKFFDIFNKALKLHHQFVIKLEGLEQYTINLFTRGELARAFDLETFKLITPPNVLNNKQDVGFSDTKIEDLTVTEQVMLAIVFDNASLLKSLLASYEREKGKDALVVFIRYNALLGFAAANGRMNSVETLLGLGANVEQKFTIKFVVAQQGRYEPNSNLWLDGSPVYEHHKDKYENSTLELTSLGLVLLAAPMIGQEQAKLAIKQLLRHGADYNVRVERSWQEEFGHHSVRKTRTKTGNTRLFDLDTTGLLSEVVKERRQTPNQSGAKPPLTHGYHGRGGGSSRQHASGSVEERLAALETENAQLRATLDNVMKRLSTLEGGARQTQGYSRPNGRGKRS